ncbi:uncharacterized protein N7483_004443 [Penicillium malachiteum]|uniref:uncharacterized protein n=1 Tax=Penicillium malachiteum TaxID=1324776 RepID=UPI0025473D00|nr:uncharacterized protein N7483_004443 [Penicillium malachiteum]KAJ5729935.1 hypothetical protein N7483_004443 [Penicillium malachiteum]
MASLARSIPRGSIPSIKPLRFSRPLTTCIRASRQPVLQPNTSHFNTQLKQSSQKRSYHSDLHPSLPPHSYTNSQTAILEAALSHVPTHGFTNTSLTLGARDAGFLDVSVQLFPRGEFDLILFWLASRRGLLRAKVESDVDFFKTGDLDVNGKIKLLILERLKMNQSVWDQWQDALAQMSLLGNIPISLAELHALSNDILSLAGDASVDSSWYTRRAAVGAIYASAEVVMTRDPSADMSETASFVERRFEDKDILAKKVEIIGQCFSFWGNTIVGVGRSYGLKI